MSTPTSPVPAGSAAAGSVPPQSASQREVAYTTVANSTEFQALRSSYRRFVFPVVLGALAFYFLYVILAAYAPGFMSRQVVGSFNIGVIFGLLQFVMVFGISAIYVRFARRTLDPAATRIRERMEREGLR